jgi:hypothetical protein
VPPQLSASFGPQARGALDALIGGGQNVSCHVRDRDHDGRLLATCRAANGTDPALALLRNGLAVAARGSIAETELAEPYVAAEQAAQSEKLGLWSMALTAPPAAEAPQPAAKTDPQKTATQNKPTEVQPKTASAVMVPNKPPVPDLAKDNPGLFARYQILIAGFLMLITTLTILGVVTINRSRERREEMRALAAALRGELLAARAVCQTRIRSIATPEDDRAVSWPRIRVTLYQAYVGRLGWLGAELARQIASIYGQASDYAAYYNHLSDGPAASATPKRQALQALVAHIDEVLPRLAGIEQTGQRAAILSRPVTVSAPLLPEPQPMQAIAPPRMAPPEKIAVETPPAAPASTEQDLHTKLRNAIRNLRERFETRNASGDEQIVDYAAIVEEDAESFSLGEDEGDEIPPAGKIGRN